MALIAVGLLVAVGVAMGTVVLRRRKRDRAAHTDELTGVGNRRRLDRDLAVEAARPDTPVAVIIADIDHFATVNEAHGRRAGDDVLREVAILMRREVRGGDVVYRNGGDQFCVLLAQTTTAEAGQVAERIRFAISRLAMTFDQPLTASVGVALGRGEHSSQTLARAAEALTRSKDEGRDRVTLAAQPLLGPLAVPPQS